MTRILALCLALAAAPATAPATASELSARITGNQILPAFASLQAETAALSDAARADCTPRSDPLRAAYHDAFDAWITASPYRFGPTEAENRAFALAYWPDSRGKIPRALSALIGKEDAGVADPERFASYSIAARGFYALEYLLYDPQLSAGSAAYRCTLTRAIAADIAATASAINAGWTGGFADELRSPKDRYPSEDAISRELLKSLTTGLQVLAEMRLGRPLGTYDNPRPERAEAHRSARSQRHVKLSLAALEPLALTLASDHPALHAQLAEGFTKARARAAALDDPALSGVADPVRRIRIEALQQDVQDLHALALTGLGPALGVDAGFNSLDGD